MNALFSFVTLLCCMALSNTLLLAKPQRIISTDRYMTEIISALGQSKRLIGIDQMSQQSDLATVANIGYRRSLSLEGLISLQPDLIFLSSDAGPDTVINQLKMTNIPYQWVNHEPYTLDTLIKAVEQIASNLGAHAAATKIIQTLKADFSQLQQAKIHFITQHKTVPVALLMVNADQKFSAAGDKTFAQHLISLTGTHNVFSQDFKGYKSVNPEGIFLRQPQIILLAKLDPSITIPDIRVVNASQWPQLNAPCLIEINTSRLLSYGIYTYKQATDLIKTIDTCLS